MKPHPDDVQNFDITDELCDLNPATGSSCPMYSYDRPSSLLWNEIARNLYARGWSGKAIRSWLQSKEPRWALDGELGEAIRKLAHEYADKYIEDRKP